MDTEWTHRLLEMRTVINPHAEKIAIERYDIILSDAERAGKVQVDLHFLLAAALLRERTIGDLVTYNVGAITRVFRKSSLGEEVLYDDPVQNKAGYLTPSFVFSKDEVAKRAVPIAISLQLFPGEYAVAIRIYDQNRQPSEFAEAAWEGSIVVPPTSELPRKNARQFSVPRLIARVASLTPDFAESLIRDYSATDEAQEASPVSVAHKGFVIELVRFDREPVMGLQRFFVRVAPEVRKVKYYLDGKLVGGVNTAPFSFDLRLSGTPRMHTVRVVAYGSLAKTAEPIGEDEYAVNNPNGTFRVYIISPASGAKVFGKTPVQVAVRNILEGQEVERVDFYLNDTLIDSVKEAPYVSTVDVPDAVSVIRTTAVLKGGVSEEAFRIVNGGGFTQYMEVNLVELYVTVVDGHGKNVPGLKSDDFAVFEKDAPQKIRKFISDFPLNVAVAIDTSGSMVYQLHAGLKAAGKFIDVTLGGQDKGFTMGIGESPYLLVGPTRTKRELQESLMRVYARGGSALWDGILFGIYRLQGIASTPTVSGNELVDMDGKRALVLLTGEARVGDWVYVAEDNASYSPYDTVLRYARESDVAIYVIGLDIQDTSKSKEFKKSVEKLASETGGKVYYVAKVDELDGVYQEIGNELRSQYYLSYQSDPPSQGGGWVPIKVRVNRKNVNVRHKSGYYP